MLQELFDCYDYSHGVVVCDQPTLCCEDSISIDGVEYNCIINYKYVFLVVITFKYNDGIWYKFAYSKYLKIRIFYTKKRLTRDRINKINNLFNQ